MLAFLYFLMYLMTYCFNIVISHMLRADMCIWPKSLQVQNFGVFQGTAGEEVVMASREGLISSLTSLMSVRKTLLVRKMFLCYIYNGSCMVWCVAGKYPTVSPFDTALDGSANLKHYMFTSTTCRPSLRHVGNLSHFVNGCKTNFWPLGCTVMFGSSLFVIAWQMYVVCLLWLYAQFPGKSGTDLALVV